ncbi:MAG: NUDIX hydrolase [Roseovarius sp. BRH_c41]|jgi:8-oxo-dGTP pyrophosphatase MutT (NUDIX family)|uniref:NUDIX hydrolase n=1 Tax=Roseovarius sp. BRH_c41 TaxID=1629709 RepID=UPI0005F1E0EE|nr:NUDIX hydrolase [Roseovarius sp. BRH_c41]KJS44596.1 MAG: NUDIX hydrolase [Roseovarius sp. BRH_c41]
MTRPMHRALIDFVRPLFRRPRRLQVAALCYREHDGHKEVLLITSRGTGRWIIPKGWPIDGKDAPGAALQEAWEEAGVRSGRVTSEAVGIYCYEKELSTGLPVPVETLVFAIEVTQMQEDYPEVAERRRKWVSPSEAAQMVQEPQLQQILRDL